MLLVGRCHVKGGETRVFQAAGPNGKRFTMLAPWTLRLLGEFAEQSITRMATMGP